MLVLGVPAWASFVEGALAFALLVAYRIDDYRVRRAGSLQADMQGVLLEGKLLVPRPAIVSAHLLATEPPTVRIVTPRLSRVAPFDVALESDVQARALLGAIGFGVGQSVATFRATYGARWRPVAVLFVLTPTMSWLTGPLMHVFGRIQGLVLAQVIFAVFVFSVLALIHTRVDVGSDGILLTTLGARRFISYRALEGAAVEGRLILLSLRTGERIRLDLLGSFSEHERSRDALAQRIEEARSAFVESKDTASTEALVAPGGRGVADWLRDIRALARARDYREARVETERLWDVVGDASAAPATRVGAAVALASAPDGDARARLRVASEGCADPKLRTALVRVADGATDEALADALAPLVGTEHPRGTSHR
jgi:hypothetical protein